MATVQLPASPAEPANGKPVTPVNPAQTPAPSSTASAMPTPALIAGMLKSAKNVSDLIFSPGRPPQVEVSGRLMAVKVPGLESLTPADTARIAADLIGQNKIAAQTLKDEGATDLSYSIPGVGRFRTNIFRQRGTHAIVMRVIASKIPTFEELNLPEELKRIAELKNGIVLVTGPTGSGKSSTLAAVLDLINSTKADHIITIEDPIEFMHPHKMATIHQRELHLDTFSFAGALRAALRQAPKVILVGEMRDRETIEIALTAAETGHLVLSTLHTIDAAKTVERIVGTFPLSEQEAIRMRLAASFRYFVAQRLLPRKDGAGRIAAFEILKATLRTKQYIEQGEQEGKTLLDCMRDGDQEGMQYFDGQLEKLVRGGMISFETAMQYATNSGNLRLTLADLDEAQQF
ncbi:MAG: PilT/PilU family type 4a pilus ATPase [Terriglobia bacterium]|nr:PilT/PilU family type 4a pilus ATPase [Terriglobia bacterium]